MPRKLDFKILSKTDEGVVTVFINGKEYVYFIDAAHYPMLDHLSHNQPGKCLQFLKKNNVRNLEGV